MSTRGQGQWFCAYCGKEETRGDNGWYCPDCSRPARKAVVTSEVIRRFIQLRDQSGESLDRVARRAGISRSTLWKIERGGDLCLSTLYALARAYRVRLKITLARAARSSPPGEGRET